MLPGAILMIVALFVDSKTAEWALNIIGLIFIIILPFMFTPLHKEDWSDSASVGKQLSIKSIKSVFNPANARGFLCLLSV
jgi:hypothetical protein